MDTETPAHAVTVTQRHADTHGHINTEKTDTHRHTELHRHKDRHIDTQKCRHTHCRDTDTQTQIIHTDIDPYTHRHT